MVFVEDHYLNFIYRKNDKYTSLTAYGKLTDFEKKLSPGFVRLNRSKLINTDHIQEIDIVNGKYRVLVKGFSRSPILVPKSRNEVVKQLIKRETAKLL